MIPEVSDLNCRLGRVCPALKVGERPSVLDSRSKQEMSRSGLCGDTKGICPTPHSFKSVIRSVLAVGRMTTTRNVPDLWRFDPAPSTFPIRDPTAEC